MKYDFTTTTSERPAYSEVHTVEHGEVVAVFYEGLPDFERRAEALAAELNRPPVKRLGKTTWVILNDDDDFWSAEHGWGDVATEFESRDHALPPGGRWAKLVTM